MSPKSRRWSRNERIIRKYYDLLADGSKTMEAYRLLAKRYNMSVGGIRYAIAITLPRTRTAEIEN